MASLGTSLRFSRIDYLVTWHNNSCTVRISYPTCNKCVAKLWRRYDTDDFRPLSSKPFALLSRQLQGVTLRGLLLLPRRFSFSRDEHAVFGEGKIEMIIPFKEMEPECRFGIILKFSAPLCTLRENALVLQPFESVAFAKMIRNFARVAD